MTMLAVIISEIDADSEYLAPHFKIIMLFNYVNFIFIRLHDILPKWQPLSSIFCLPPSTAMILS